MTLPPWLVCALPFGGAVAAGLVPSDRVRAGLVPLAAGAHLSLVGAAVWGGLAIAPNPWLGLDPLSRLLLLQVASVAFLCSLYAPFYVALRPERSARVFCAGVLAVLGAMSLTILARHLGLMWVALELATLFSAPLLYFNRNRRSIEGTWKYLLVGSVGIALALLGSFFVAYAAYFARLDSSLRFEDLAAAAPQLSRPWLHAGIVLLLVGYGTKLGLAPMHTWKPDAYGEAPGVVGALLAGGMTTCALLAILRVLHLARLAGEGESTERLLVVLGVFSMAVAAVFLVRQDDVKRLLAYSSVEHMGIVAVGLGIGGAGVFGALYHVVNNGFAKGVVFLAAGNLHRACGTKLASRAPGGARLAPASALLLLLGFLAVTGAPPFGPFFSELAILEAALGSGNGPLVAAFCVLVLLAFVGMGSTVLQVTQGEPDPGARPAFHEAAGGILPIVAFLAVSALLGAWLPAPVRALLQGAADFVENG